MTRLRRFAISAAMSLVAVGLVIAAVVVPTDVQQPGTQPGEVGALETPDKCDNCHGGYNRAVEPAFNWRGSLMANAGRDPLFWATMAIAEQDFDGAGDFCLRCHSTAGWQAGHSTPTDGSGLQPTDADGVDCDTCHKMTDPNNGEHQGAMNEPFVANDGNGKGYYGSGMLSLWGGNQKLGPYADADPKHQFAQSRFHRSVDFCGSCHDVSNPVVGDLAHNNGKQPTGDPVVASGVPGSPVGQKAAFNNFPYQYGVVERTFSEHKAGALSQTLVKNYAGLPSDLKAGAIQAAFDSAKGDYSDGTPRYFSCQTCHMKAVTGAGANKPGTPTRTDLPLHDLTGGGVWVPDAIIYQNTQGTMRLGGGLTTDQIDALNAGKERARQQLQLAAALAVSGNTLKVTNLTGHKVISGYPEGRRMWLNVKWYDGGNNLLREDGKYDVVATSNGTPVKSIVDLADSNTKIYEAHYGMTQEWASQLLALGKPAALPLGFDRVTGAVNYTLGQLAAQAPGTHHETFHFVLNNTVVKDNRIPTYGMAYEEARKRNALPVPATQYGGGTASYDGMSAVYRYWDEVALNPPAGATRAAIGLLYQSTTWEYIQFLRLANNGSVPFLANEGVNLLNAWLNTGMAEPVVMASATWTGTPQSVSPQITSASATTCQVGVACVFTVTTTGHPVPAITRSGSALPAGMSFTDNGNGTAAFSGTPGAGAGGTYTYTLGAANGVLPNAAQPFTLTVNQAPALTSAASTSCVVGSACAFTVTTTGYPTPAIERSGAALPGGMSYVDNGNGSGTLAGTPGTGTGGLYALVFTAANGIGANAAQNFSLSVNQPPAITSAVSTTCIVGTPCSFTVIATGFPLPAIGRTGAALPAGLTYSDNGNGSGTLAGTPGAGTGGVYALTFTAANGVGSNATQPFALTVNQAPAITSVANATCTAGAACSFNVTTIGYPTPAIARSGAALPTGMNYVDNGNGTGTLAGTPGAGTGGLYAQVFTATNGIGTNAAQNFSLTVNQPPAITSAPPPGGQPGASYNHVYTATGYPAPTFQITAGALPNELTLATGGTLAGTPTQAGTFTGTVTASNGVLPNATQLFSITIASGATVATAPLEVSALSGNGQASVGFLPPTSDGGAPISSYTATCTPNAGATFFVAGSSSPLVVAPLVNGLTYTCTVRATNSAGDSPESAPSNPVTPSAAPPAALTLAITGSGTGTVSAVPGGIACPGDCIETYPAGTGVILTAMPTGGSVFAGWLGGGCSFAPTCTVTIEAAATVSATFSPAGIIVSLDIDASAPTGTYDALTDGLLLMRHLFGLSGPALTNGVLGATATRTDAGAIATYLEDIRPALDIDGNGQVDALTDGLLILRYLFGVTGQALLNDAVGAGATRNTAEQVEAYLQGLIP